MKSPKLIIIGGNRQGEDGPLLNFSIEAMRQGIEIQVISGSWHLNLPTSDGNILADRFKLAQIPFLEVKTLTVEILSEVLSPNSWGILINCRWILRKQDINLFGGRLFNYHNARLPQEKGAAAYTWKILSGVKEGALNIHKVEEKIDSGEILLTKKLTFPESCVEPTDFYQFMGDKEREIFAEFLTILKCGQLPNLFPQKAGKHCYWPRLNTSKNGYISWQWDAISIVRFINGFGDPFSGAMTFWNGIKLHLMDASIDPGFENFHPFQSGIVFHKSENSLFIAACGGAIVVNTILDDMKNSMFEKISPGIRFHTPTAILESALT